MKDFAKHIHTANRVSNSKTENREYSTDDFKSIKEKAQRIADTTSDESKKKRALEIVDRMRNAHNQPNWEKQVEYYEQEIKKIGNSKVGNTLREYRNRSRDLMATIDFNSDGTDADVEVYNFDFDTGEEGRTIEEKHFDTIQEAEAYISGKYGLRR